MGDLQTVIARSSTRGRWSVEESMFVDGRYHIRSPELDVIADGMCRFDAERLAESFNRVCDDAAVLAGAPPVSPTGRQVPPTPASRFSITTGSSSSAGSNPNTFE